MDIAIEVPSDELTSVTSQVMWEEIFDKLAAYTATHRSTLVFVNTRKLVERVSLLYLNASEPKTWVRITVLFRGCSVSMRRGA